MSAAIGWAGLILIVYFFIALFLVDTGTKRALAMAATGGEFESEARTVLNRNHRARVRWIKQHMSRLPERARTIAQRVVFLDASCWIALIGLFVLYGFQFFAP